MDATQDRYCRACGYLLRALPEHRCPECGTDFDPDDPLSFTTRTRPHAFLCWLSRPLGWPMHTLTALTVCISLWAGIVPGGYFGLTLLSLGAWIVLGVVWLLRLVARFGIMKRYGLLEESDGGSWRSWIVAPMLCALTLVAASTHASLYAGFFISRSAMNCLVNEARALPVGSRIPDRRIGIYTAEDIEVTVNGVQFFVKGAGFIDREGFSFSSGAPATSHHGFSYRPLIGDWYLLHWDF
jgi:hypothetical protein